MGIDLVTSGKVPGYFCPLWQFNVVLRTNGNYGLLLSALSTVH